MGNRERRYVPANWEHPKNAKGQYIPLFYDYDADNVRYQEGVDFITRGFESKMIVTSGVISWEWVHNPSIIQEAINIRLELWKEEDPTPYLEADQYMPRWSSNERTHVQLYETTSEGTPVSPIFKTDFELTEWISKYG